MVRRPSVVVTNFKHVSATSWPITTKFYLKHHWVGGKAALGFGPDRIRTVVSTATESSHSVIMEKTVSPLFSSPEPKAHGELIVYQSSRRLSGCVSVCVCVSVCKHFQT